MRPPIELTLSRKGDTQNQRNKHFIPDLELGTKILTRGRRTFPEVEVLLLPGLPSPTSGGRGRGRSGNCVNQRLTLNRTPFPETTILFKLDLL